MMTSMGEGMTSAGKALSKGVTAPITAVGAASVKAWKDVDTGLDTIVQKTGASGEALNGMKDMLTNIATTIPTDFATAGAAIGEVSTRFGVTGEELEALSTQFVKFAQLNGTDVSNSIDSVQAAMAAFGVETESAGDILDIMNKVGQDTGVSMDSLASDLLANNAVLQDAGLGFNEAANFLGNLSKNGVDSSSVMTGLRRAMANAAEEGKSTEEALAEVQEGLMGASSDAEAAQIAMELFGTRGGASIAQMVRDGRISFDDFSGVVTDWGDSVSTTFANTQDPMDDFQMTLNELKLVGADVIEAAGPALKDVLGGMAEGIKTISDAWNGLSPGMQDFIIKAAGLVALLGPILLIGGKIIGGIGTLTSGIGGLVGKIGGLGSSAASAATPMATAGASFGTMAGQALQLLAAAAALYITAQAFSVLADAAIRITEAGWPAVAVLGGMIGGIVGLMAAASAFGPAMTAGAIGIGVFGAAMLAIGGGIDLACQGIAKVTEAITGLVDVVLSHSEEINSIVTNIGETVNGTITTISDGISGIIESLSGGISGVLDSVAGVIDSIGEAALNAGTGFEKLANAVMNLVNNTGVMDLGATLGTVAGGVKDINKAAADAGTSATNMRNLGTGLKAIVTAGAAAGTSFNKFGADAKNALNGVSSAFRGVNLAASMKTAMAGAIQSAQAGINQLRGMFANTRFNFNQKIAVPHFTMSGEFNAQTKATPTIVTRWYAKAAEQGALFTEPTIIGVGEAAPEVLLGEEKLKELVKGGTTVNNYITVSGAQDPEAWASKFARQMKLEMRMA